MGLGILDWLKRKPRRHVVAEFVEGALAHNAVAERRMCVTSQFIEAAKEEAERAKQRAAWNYNNAEQPPYNQSQEQD